MASDPASTPVPNAAASTVNGQQQALTAGAALGGAATREGDTQAAAAAAAAAASAAGPAEAAAAAELAAAAADTEEGNTAFLDALAEASPAVAAAAVAATARAVAAAAAAAPVAELERVVDSTSSNSTAAAAQNAYLRLRASRRNPQTTGLAADSKDAAVQLLQQHSTRHSSSLAGDDIVTLVLRLRQQQQEQQALFALEARRQQSQARLSYLLALQQRQQHVRQLRAHLTECRHLLLRIADHTIGELQQESAAAAAAGSSSSSSSSSSSAARAVCVFEGLGGVSALVDIATGAASLPAGLLSRAAPAVVTQIKELLHVVLSESFYLLREFVLSHQAVAEQLGHHTGLLRCLLSCLVCPAVCDAAELLLEELIAPGDSPLSLHFCSPSWLAAAVAAEPSSPTAAAATSAAITAAGGSATLLQGSWGELHVRHVALLARLLTLLIVETDERLACSNSLWLLRRPPTRRSRRCAAAAATVAAHSPGAHSQQKQADNTPQGISADGSAATSSNSSSSGTKAWSPWLLQPLGEVPRGPKETRESLSRLIEMGPLHCSSSNSSSRESSSGSSSENDAPDASIGHPSSHGRSRKHRLAGGAVLLRRQQQQQQEEANWLQRRRSRSAAALLLGRGKLQSDDEQMCEHRKAFLTPGGPCCSEGGCSSRHSSSCCACVDSNRDILLQQPQLVERLVELLRLQSIPLPGFLSGVMCGGGGPVTATTDTGDALLELLNNSNVPLFDLVLGEPAGSRSTRGQHASRRTSSGQARAAPRSSAAAAVGGGGGAAAAGPGRRSSSNNTAVELRGALDGRAMAFASRLGLPYTRRRPRGIPDGGPTAVDASSGGRVNTSISAAAAAHPYAAPANAAAAVARRDAADESRGGQRTPLLQRLTAALSFFGAEGQQASAAPPAASAAADNGSSSSRQLGALGEWGDAASAGFVGEGAGAAGAPAEAAAGAVTNSATEGTQFRGFMEEVIAAAAADGIAVGEPDLLGAPDDLDALAAAVAGPGEVSIGIEFLAPVSIPEQQQQHDQPLSSLEDAAATAAASAATARQSAADAAAAAEAVEFASDAIRGVAEEPPAASRAVWTVSALVGSQQQQQQQQQQQRTLVHVLLEPADGTEDPDASLGWFNMTPQQRRDLLPQQQQQPQQDTETLQQELQTQQQQQQAMLVVQRHLLLHNQQGLGTQDELQLRQLFNRTHQLYRQHRAALKRRNRRRKRNPQHHSSSSSSSSSRSLAAASPPSGAAGGLGPDEGQAEQEDQQRQQQQQQDQQQDSTFMGRLLRRLSTLSFGVSRSHEAVAAAEDAVRAAATFSLDGIQGGGNNASAAANFPEGKQQHWLRRRRRRPSFSGSKRSRCSSSSSHRSSSGSSSSSSSEHGEPVGEPQGRRGLFAAGPPGQSAAASKRQQQQQDQGRLSRRDRYKRRKLQQRQQRRLALQGTDGFPPQPLMKTLSADEGHSSSSSNSSFMSSATEDEAAELQHLQELEIRKVASANSRASRLPLAALAPFRPSFATRSFLQQQRSQAAERSMSSSSSSSSRRGDVSTAATGRARQRGEADFAAPRLPHAERAAAAAAPAAAEQSVVLDASLPLHEQAQQVLQFYTSRSPGSPALGPSDSLQQQQEQQQQQQQQLQRQQEAVVSRSASSDSASAAEGVGDDASRLGLLSWRQWASSLWGSSRSLSDVAANAVAADTHRPRGDAAASNAAAATAATADASAAAARAPTAPERRRRLGGLRAGRIMARQQQQQQQVQQQVQLPSGGSVHDVLMAALQTLRGIVARQNSGALEFILSSVLQQIAPPAHSYVLRMSTILPHTALVDMCVAFGTQSELYFVICSLMGGRTRAAVQRRLGRLGIVRVVGDLLEAQLWFTPDPLAHQWLPSTAEQQQQQQQQDNGTEEGLRGDGNCAGSSNSSSNNGSEGDEGEGAPPSCRPTANAEAWSEGPPVRRRRHSSNTAQSTNVFNSSSSSSNSSSNSSIGSRNSSSNASSTIYRATGAAFDTSLSALPPPPASSERLCCCETSLCSFALELLRLIHDLGDYESGPVAAELRREMLTAHERNIVMHALRAPRRVDLRPPLIRAVRQRLRVIHPHPLVDPDKHRRSAAATSSNNNNNSSSSSSSRRSSSAGMAMDTQPQEQRTEARAAQVEDSTASPAASESSQQEPQESRQRRAGAAASDGTSSSNSSSSTSSGETAGTHRSSEQFGRIATRYIFKGTAGLLCRLICIYGHEPPSSLYKFWLASSIEACIRGSDPLIKVFAAESGLLQILLSDMHAIALEQRRLQNKQEEQGSAALPAAVEMLQEGGAVSDSNSSSSNGSSSSSSAAQRGMLQSCCDLLGELLKFNPYVLLLLDRHFARDPAALAVFTSTIEDNLIDTNVLVRSLYLTAELCRQTARVHTLAAASEVLKLPQGPADACAVDQQVEAAAAVAAAAAAAAAADAAAEGRELLREHRYLPLWRQMHFFDRNSSSPITLHGSQEEEEKQQRQQGQSCLSKGMPHDSDSCCATGGFAAPTGLTIPFADGGSLRKLLRRFQNSSSRLLANDNSSCSSSRFLASDCSSSSSSEAIVDALGLSGGNPAGKSDQLSHAGGEQLLFPQQHQQQQQQDEDVCYWDLAPLGIGLRPDPSPAMVASVLQGSRELHAVFSGKYRADVSLLLDPEKSPIAKFITERRTEILKRLMCAVSFEGVVPDSICCVNTSLVLLLLTLLDGQLPETLREIKQQFNKAEAELAASGSPVGVGPLLQRLIQGDRSHEQQHSLQKREEPIQQQEEQQQERKQGDGVQRQHQQQQRVQEDTDDRSLEESMGVGAFNFWRLLHFWRVHYMRRRKDARGLEFASQIPLHYWHERQLQQEQRALLQMLP
ncbi:hypothetical protein Emag_003155 [Eimeria magna]